LSTDALTHLSTTKSGDRSNVPCGVPPSSLQRVPFPPLRLIFFFLPSLTPWTDTLFPVPGSPPPHLPSAYTLTFPFLAFCGILYMPCPPKGSFVRILLWPIGGFSRNFSLDYPHCSMELGVPRRWALRFPESFCCRQLHGHPERPPFPFLLVVTALPKHSVFLKFPRRGGFLFTSVGEGRRPFRFPSLTRGMSPLRLHLVTSLSLVPGPLHDFFLMYHYRPAEVFFLLSLPPTLAGLESFESKFSRSGLQLIRVKSMFTGS